MSPSEPFFRPMQAADLPQVVAVERLAFSHPWPLSLYEDALERYECWVLQSGGQHLGHAVLQRILDEAHLLNIVIALPYQGRGYGRCLLEFILQRAEQQACRECFLELRESNQAAYQLYEQLGFNEIGRRKDYYPAASGQEDAIVMACTLAM